MLTGSMEKRATCRLATFHLKFKNVISSRNGGRYETIFDKRGTLEWVIVEVG